MRLMESIPVVLQYRLALAVEADGIRDGVATSIRTSSVPFLPIIGLLEKGSGTDTLLLCRVRHRGSQKRFEYSYALGVGPRYDACDDDERGSADEDPM